jgi:hypothetical protein
MHNIKRKVMTDLCWRKMFLKVASHGVHEKNSDDWTPAKILWKLLIMSVVFQVETELKGC